MSRVSITREKLDELALQVSGKSGEPLPLTIDDMADAVAGIPYPPSLQSKSAAPTETAQTITADSGYDGLSSVDVGAISSTYIGSGIIRRVGSDVTNSGRMVTVPYGYYSTTVSRLVAAGTAGTPTATKGTVSNHSVSVTPSVTNTTGYITGSTKTGTAVTVTASELESGTKSITANGTGIDVTGYAAVDVAVPSSQPNLQSKLVAPTESAQIVTPDAGYDGLSRVSVGSISSTYVGSGITRCDSSDLTASGATVTVPSGYYAVQASKAVANGTAGTPTASKGSVSNHSVSVTPSVTNTAGYISGGTETGTAVSVSASELVSGTYTVGASGTHDVTNYASASVAAGGATASATKGSVSNHSVTVTPSVTRTAGYVTAGTSNGTAVTVSASELVSGSETKTENGTYDVTNLAELVVNVSGGGGGTVQVGTKTATLASTASAISFTGLSGNPTSFAVTSQADISTGGDLVSGVVFDGTSIHAQTVTTQAEYAGTGFSKSYSGGTLTITASGASFAANSYKLVYTYGGSSSDIHTANVQVGSGATSITFSGLSGRPAYFSVIFKSDFGTSSGYQRVIEVVNDGTDTYGMCLDSTAHAASYWTYSYSGGALTVTSQGTNAGGYFHQPGNYQLTYAVDSSAPSYQTKTGIGATTTSQTITADAGYDALESVQINAITQTNLTAANIKSGTTVTISNGNGNLWSVLGTYSGGGGSSSIDTKTATNSDDQATSLAFSSMKGQPIAFFLRCTSQLTRSSSYSYYYITDMRYNGTNTTGNYYRRSNGTFYNDTSHYSFSYSGTTLTISSSASRGAAGGSFYNGGYELVYIY